MRGSPFDCTSRTPNGVGGIPVSFLRKFVLCAVFVEELEDDAEVRLHCSIQHRLNHSPMPLIHFFLLK